MELYELWKPLMRDGTASFWQEFYVKFYQAFIDGNRWKQYLNGVGTTLLVTALALALGVVLALAASVAATFDGAEERCGVLLNTVEIVTSAFFAVDYVLRVWTARCLYPTLTPGKATVRYVSSIGGLIDLASFLPTFLPVFFPSGMVAFRMFRVVRIFRLFRINTYYDSLHVITEVLRSKRQQLLSSVFIILTLMLASSLCMYSLEHEAQPEVFRNAFSGIWWSVSTLLTVGYGDIYPITTAGKIFGIVITFLGVGMVAIPTGIISAGFVDQYSRIKRISEYGQASDVHFIQVYLRKKDAWVGKTIRDAGLPGGVIAAAIQRGGRIVMPRGDTVLEAGDTLVLGAQGFRNDQHIDLKEITLRRQNPWVGQHIRELDISRRTLIVLVRRDGKALIPHGDLRLREGDTVVLYTQTAVRSGPETEEIIEF